MYIYTYTRTHALTPNTRNKPLPNPLEYIVLRRGGAARVPVPSAQGVLRCRHRVGLHRPHVEVRDTHYFSPLLNSYA